MTENKSSFSPIQHLILILKESDELCSLHEKKWEENYEEAAALRLQNAYQIRNLTFAELMREGVKCNFIRDLELGTKEIMSVILQVNTEQYECRAIVLQKILGNEYSVLCGLNHAEESQVQVFDNDNIGKKDMLGSETNDEMLALRKLNEPSSISGKRDIKPEPEIKEDRPVFKKKNDHKQQSTDLENIIRPKAHIQNKDKNKALVPINDKPNTAVNSAPSFHYVEPKTPESVKELNTMLFELNDVGIFNKNDGKGEYVNFTIVPLTIPYNGNETVSDIFVCTETTEEKKVYVSEKKGQKSVSVHIGDYEFIIHGSFKDGIFNSTIYPANQALAENFDQNEEKTAFTPDDFSKIGFGHNVDFFKESDGTISKIHIIPIDLQNNAAGMVNVMVCIEKTDGTRWADVSNDNMVIYRTEDIEVQIFGYWEGEKTFVTNVKKR